MLAIALCVALVASTQSPREVTFYVAPDGSDERGGRSPRQAMATPRAAFQRAERERIGQGIGERPIHVEFAAGRYELSEPLEALFGNGGTEKCPTTYAAAPGATVVFSGGSRLGPWRETELNGRKVMAADLPASLRNATTQAADRDPPFRTMWVNGQRRPWARHPNDGSFLHVQGFPDDLPKGDWTKGQTAMVFSESDAPAWSRIAPGAEVVTFTRWVDSHLRVMSVDAATRTARFASPNVLGLAPGDLYYTEGDASLLDAPGEWWCDSKAGVVYTIPMPGENLNDPATEAIVPRLSTLMKIGGEADTRYPTQHAIFRGITFAHARWWFPQDFKAAWPSAEVIGFNQAAAGAPGAVRIEGAHHITFDRCTFEHVEAYGLELGRGVKDCTIKGCTVRDLGAGGIKIGETAIREKELDRTRANVIEDCTITDGGHIHHQAVGVWIGQSAGNRLSHNLISEFDYTGISIGWTWGYGPALAAGNIVEFNEVRNLGPRPGNAEPPLGDMAGIYTLGIQGPTADAPDQSLPRTIIRNNFFHDIAGRTIAWGIYFDEGSTGIVAENNLVLRTTHGSFHQHYGRDNTVRNNILAMGRDAQLWRTRREEHNSFTISNNIVVGDSDIWLNGDWSDHFVLQKNLYWRTGGKPIVFPGARDFAAWQAAGYDAGSVVDAPRLNLDDPKHPRIGNESAAAVVGFAAFDISTVGPRVP